VHEKRDGVEQPNAEMSLGAKRGGTPPVDRACVYACYKLPQNYDFCSVLCLQKRD